MQPVEPICPLENSWICEKSQELNIQPETVYGWVYSASAVAAISDIVEIKEICDFEKQVADFYVAIWPISYSSLIDEIIRLTDLMPAEKAILIKNIININIMKYRNAELISSVDDIILRKGHVAFRRDMACFDDN